MRKLILAAAFAISVPATSQSLTGLWDAKVKLDDLVIPCKFEISGDGNEVRGAFFNGDLRVPSTSGRRSGNALILNFDHYATRLDVTFDGTALNGRYGLASRMQYEFHATRHQDSPQAKGPAPSIGGLWEIVTDSPKGERAWRFIVRQNGPEVAAAILRVDGDTGTLTGAFENGRFLLSHFSGARPSVLEISPRGDGTLALTLKGPRGRIRQVTAVRSSEARAKGLPQPEDPALHTRMKNPQEPFRFSFPDLTGHFVSSSDSRFRNKVVIVTIMGSWCPNCHDEAPFLAELYRKYRSLGVEVVALDFEDPDQRKDPTRLQAFIKKYGIEYTVLMAGEPSELETKVPQAENLNAWPTTFFLGRDGRVRSIHAGFAAAATGEYHVRLKREITTLVERLASEATRASR